MIRLLEEPALIQQELDRRLAAARSSDPTRKREQSLQRELTHVGKGIERLLNAYQEGLLSIEQLRERMPLLRQRQQALRVELQAIADQTNDRTAFLRLAETLTAFLARLRSAAETLSVTERQRIVRLLVKDVLVGEDTITIRHSIPINSGPPQNGSTQVPDGQNYLLCTGRDPRPLWRTFLRLPPLPFLHHSGFQPFLDQPQDARIGYAVLDKLQHPFVIEMIEKPTNVCVQHIVHPLRLQRYRQRIQRLMLAAPRSEPIGESHKVFLINLVEDDRHGLLDQLVFQRRHAQRSLPSVGFRDIGSPRWLGSIRSAMDATVQILQPTFQPRLILLPGHAVYSGCRFSLHPIEAFPQPINAQMVEQGGELQLLVLLCCLPHTRQPLGHASPALRREHVELSSVLLDQRPSLPTLRKLAIVFVRMVHRYYAAVRLLRDVHASLTALAFARRPAALPAQQESRRSPGSRA